VEKQKKRVTRNGMKRKTPQGKRNGNLCLHMEMLLLLCLLLCCCFHYSCHYFGWNFHPFARTLPSHYPPHVEKQQQITEASEKCTYCMNKGSLETSIKVGDPETQLGRYNYISRVINGSEVVSN